MCIGDYRRGFGLGDWIYCTLYIHNTGLQAIQHYHCSAHLTVILTYTLGFSVFTSRILATDLYVSLALLITYWVFFSQPNSISFPYSATANFEDSTPITLLPSSYPGRLATRSSRPVTSDWTASTTPATWSHFLCPFITPQHRPHRKHNLYCWRDVFTVPLPCNTGPIVARLRFARMFTVPLLSNAYTRHSILHLSFV
jgi:hypothetical protein